MPSALKTSDLLKAGLNVTSDSNTVVASLSLSRLKPFQLAPRTFHRETSSICSMLSSMHHTILERAIVDETLPHRMK